MSLLADLLSRIRNNGSHGGEEIPPQYDIPPTLSGAKNFPPKVRGFNRRYATVTVVVLALAAVALGALLMEKFATAPAPVAPQPPAQHAMDPGNAPSHAPQPPPQAPQAAPQESLHSNAARINLGEPLSRSDRQDQDATATTAPPPVPKAPPAQRSWQPPRSKERPLPRQRMASATGPAPAAELPASGELRRPGREGGSRDSFLYAARSAEQSGDWKGAAASYRRALELDPGNYRVLSNLAAALNNLALFDEAAREADRALNKKPDYVPALINAAIAHSSLGDPGKARRLLSAALALEPGNRRVALNLGILYERSRDFDGAAGTYRPLAAAGDPLALAGLGRVWEAKGKKREAIGLYHQILEQPGAPPALKGEVSARLGRLEE